MRLQSLPGPPRASLGPSEKFFLTSPAKLDRLNIFTRDFYRCAKQNKTKQKEKPKKTKENKTEQKKIKQNKTKQNRRKQNETEQNRRKQNKTE